MAVPGYFAMEKTSNLHPDQVRGVATLRVPPPLPLLAPVNRVRRGGPALRALARRWRVGCSAGVPSRFRAVRALARTPPTSHATGRARLRPVVWSRSAGDFDTTMQSIDTGPPPSSKVEEVREGPGSAARHVCVGDWGAD